MTGDLPDLLTFGGDCRSFLYGGHHDLRSLLATLPDAGVSELAAYVDAVLAELPDELKPEHRDDTTFRGLSLMWNGPDAWPYGIGVIWDGNLGWLYLEGGVRHATKAAPLIDELVPYPELVAQALERLLLAGPAGLPLEGATRWPGADELLAALEFGA